MIVEAVKEVEAHLIRGLGLTCSWDPVEISCYISPAVCSLHTSTCHCSAFISGAHVMEHSAGPSVGRSVCQSA